ncbi:MAG: hypothetical protein LW720_18830 [Pirellula sp.]|nr:hypothetical protein [Pirellula sp.]
MNPVPVILSNSNIRPRQLFYFVLMFIGALALFTTCKSRQPSREQSSSIKAHWVDIETSTEAVMIGCYLLGDYESSPQLVIPSELPNFRRTTSDSPTARFWIKSRLGGSLVECGNPFSIRSIKDLGRVNARCLQSMQKADILESNLFDQDRSFAVLTHVPLDRAPASWANDYGYDQIEFYRSNQQNDQLETPIAVAQSLDTHGQQLALRCFSYNHRLAVGALYDNPVVRVYEAAEKEDDPPKVVLEIPPHQGNGGYVSMGFSRHTGKIAILEQMNSSLGDYYVDLWDLNTLERCGSHRISLPSMVNHWVQVVFQGESLFLWTNDDSVYQFDLQAGVPKLLNIPLGERRIFGIGACRLQDKHTELFFVLKNFEDSWHSIEEFLALEIPREKLLDVEDVMWERIVRYKIGIDTNQ